MAITKAVKGAIVSRDELLSSFGETAAKSTGKGLRSLVEKGVITVSPEQGQFEFQQDFDLSSLGDIDIGQAADDIRGGVGDITDSFDAFKGFFNNEGFDSTQLEDEFDEFKIEQDRRAKEKLKIKQEGIELEVAEAKEDVRELGERAIGGTRARSMQPTGAGTTGLGVSSTLSQALAPIIKATSTEIKSLEKRKEQALANAEFDIADELDKKVTKFQDRLDKMKEQEIELRQQTFNNMLALRTAERGDVQTQISLLGQLRQIPEGETVTVGGVTYTGMKKSEIQPFFTSASIVSLMKEIPVGEEETITDPNTGTEYTIQGLAQIDPDIKTFTSTNNKTGEVTLSSYRITDEGVELMNQVSAGAIGGRLKGTGDGGDITTGWKKIGEFTDPETGAKFITERNENTGETRQTEVGGAKRLSFEQWKEQKIAEAGGDISAIGQIASELTQEAYEREQPKTLLTTPFQQTTEPTQTELESSVWAWLSTEEAQVLDNEQLKQEIMGAGFNPEDFGIY